MQPLVLAKAFLVDMVRQKTIIFSCFILPLVITWSTWWVTADLPMDFRLDTGDRVQASMIEVHLVTGALTAMAITAGLFSFLVISESRRVADRLRLTGYRQAAIAMGPFVAIFIVLIAAAGATVALTASLDSPASWGGLVLSISLTTLVYSALGAALGTVFPRPMEGSFTILMVSFIDLMLVSNPMGVETYLDAWTYWAPGFWPTQVALEGGLLGTLDGALKATGYTVVYASLLMTAAFIARVRPPATGARA